MECGYSKSLFSMEFEATRSAPSYRYDSVSDRIVSIGALVERISTVESDLTANSEDPFIVIFDAMKSKVPKFDGADPEGWISQIDRLFNSYNAPEEWRLRLVSYHMEGRADDWFLWSLANNHLLTWTEFKFRLQQYFGCPIYEPNFAESQDTIRAGSKNLKSANAELRFEEAISSAEFVQEEFGAETDNFELTSTKVKESRGNLGENNLNSSGSSESAHPEDPKLEVKSEANTGSYGLVLAHVLTSIPVFPLAHKVFDEMAVTNLSSFKEPDASVNIWEPITNFMEERKRTNNSQQSDFLFDPGGSGRISNNGGIHIGLPSVVQFLVRVGVQINPQLKILSYIVSIMTATKGRSCLTIHQKHFPTCTIISAHIYYSVCISSLVWVIVWFIVICRTKVAAFSSYDGCNGFSVVSYFCNTLMSMCAENLFEVMMRLHDLETAIFAACKQSLNSSGMVVPLKDTKEWFSSEALCIDMLELHLCIRCFRKEFLALWWLTKWDVSVWGSYFRILDEDEFLEDEAWWENCCDIVGTSATCERIGIMVWMVIDNSLRTPKAIAQASGLLINDGIAFASPKFLMVNKEFLLEIIPNLHDVATGKKTNDAMRIGGMESWLEIYEQDGGVQVVAILACCKSMELFEPFPTLRTRWFSLGNGMIHQLGLKKKKLTQ